MMRFNRSLLITSRFFGGGKQDPSIPKVTDYKQNKQIRDKLHLKFLDQADLDTLYQHRRTRKSTALYNIMRYLPNKVTQQIAKLSSDTKVILRSDNLYLPKLTPNGVPVYDSVKIARFVLLVRSFQVLVPFFIFHLHYPAPMFITSILAYLGIYKPVFQKLGQSFVVKMQLSPETEQLLVQRVGWFGLINTTRIKIDDLQIYDKSKLNILFYRSTRSLIDPNLIFKVKSTGELLMFDPQGYWYQEGINHQMLI